MGSFDSLRDDLRGEMQHIRRHLDALEERLNNFTELWFFTYVFIVLHTTFYNRQINCPFVLNLKSFTFAQTITLQKVEKLNQRVMKKEILVQAAACCWKSIFS